MKNLITLTLFFLVFGVIVSPLHAQGSSNSQSKGATVMAQKWEYKFILRTRSAGSMGNIVVSDWEVLDDGKSLGRGVDMLAVCKKLGDDGWELVSVSPRSSQVRSGEYSLSGVTTDELWVFKRAK